MGDEPFRSLYERRDSPCGSMTIEQRVDTRLCVSSLTPQQCRQMMCQLDDQSIKNAVYDRALCFPFDQWTDNIRKVFGRQVEHDNRVVTSFENITNHMDSLFSIWRHVVMFKESDYENITAHVKSYVLPSIDNIGVYGTFSEHITTKNNAMAALLKAGQIIVGMPILTSQRGVTLFVYDSLSRAVGNVLSTATTDAIRRQILSIQMESDFLELTKRCAAIGLFPGLLSAVTSGSGAVPYNVPLGHQLEHRGNKRPSADCQLGPAAKKIKVPQGDPRSNQADPGRERDAKPGPSRASSHQPQAPAAEPSGPRNPFSRPSSAGPVSLPLSESLHALLSNTEAKNGRGNQAYIDPRVRASKQGTEFQGIAKRAAENQPESQNAPQMTEGGQGQGEKAAGDDGNTNPGTEAQIPTTNTQQQMQGAQTQQQQQLPPPQTGNRDDTSEYERPDYDTLLQRIEAEVFHATATETCEQQLERAPKVVALINGTAGIILKSFQRAASECHERGRRDIFLKSLNDTFLALLWIIESCGLNIGGTELSAEVSAKVCRDSLVGALWGSVRLASAAECKRMLDVKDGNETFGEKLERVSRQLDEKHITGFGGLRFILDNMRGGDGLVPARKPSSQPHSGAK